LRQYERGKLAADRFTEPTITKLLDPVSDGADEQVPAKPRRLAAIEPPPLFAQFVRTEIAKSLKPSRNV
jgi:hypothetical protein